MRGRNSFLSGGSSSVGIEFNAGEVRAGVLGDFDQCRAVTTQGSMAAWGRVDNNSARMFYASSTGKGKYPSFNLEIRRTILASEVVVVRGGGEGGVRLVVSCYELVAAGSEFQSHLKGNHARTTVASKTDSQKAGWRRRRVGQRTEACLRRTVAGYACQNVAG